MQPGTEQPPSIPDPGTSASAEDTTPAESPNTAGTTAPSTEDPVGEGTGRKRRRRRRGRRRRGDGARQGDAGAQPATRPEATLQPSLLDQSLPADHPLSEDEAAEMRRHLKFINIHRNALRLRLNAKEDLLVNGVRPPEHRGICMHLLSKIDLASVKKALDRVGDARARTRLLAGVVRFSTDLGILLLYLESFVDAASRRDAAAAFSLAVTRMDFASVSPARMERILELIENVFAEEHERAQVVFGLLHSQSFRAALDAVDERLPYALRGHFTALLAVHEVIIEGKPDRFPRALLAHGVESLLSAPEDSLRALPEPIRVRLLEVALSGDVDPEQGDRAAGAMLDSLNKTSDAYRGLALARSRSLLDRGLEKRARWQMKQLKSAQPDCKEARALLDVLDAPRLGNLALVWPGRQARGSSPPKAREGWNRAYALDLRRRVWLQVGKANESRAFEAASAIHAKLVLGGLLPLVASGVAKGGIPYRAVAATGQPVTGRPSLGEPSLDRYAALGLQGVQLLSALATAGYILPDLAPDRFLLVKGPRPTLLLADLSGIEEAGSEEARIAHSALAAAWLGNLFETIEPQLPNALTRLLGQEEPRLTDLAKLLSIED